MHANFRNASSECKENRKAGRTHVNVVGATMTPVVRSLEKMDEEFFRRPAQGLGNTSEGGDEGGFFFAPQVASLYYLEEGAS